MDVTHAECNHESHSGRIDLAHGSGLLRRPQIDFPGVEEAGSELKTRGRTRNTRGGVETLTWLRVAARKRLRKSSIVHEIRKPNLAFWIFGSFRMLARFSKYDFWNLEKILGLYRKKSVKKYVLKKLKKNVNKNQKHIFWSFFRSGTQRVKDILIRSYRIKHYFQLKFFDFPLFFKRKPRNAIHCRGMLELPRVFWTVFWKSRDLVQTVEKNLDRKYYFISAKNILKIFFEIIFFFRWTFWFFGENFEKFWWKFRWKFWFVVEIFDEHFDQKCWSKFLIFRWKFWKPKFWKKYFQHIFSPRWKNVFGSVFFYCLD